MRLGFFGLVLLACGQRAADADVHEATAQPATAVAPEPAANVVPDASPPAPPAEAEVDPLTAPSTASTSVGSPNDGRLEGGVALPAEGPGFIHNPRRSNAEARWGTVEMVGALVRAAAVVDRDLPGSRLVINDLGLPGGGAITHHGSHRAGRDVDVLFYLLDADGHPLPSVGAPLDTHGRGWDFKDIAIREDDVRLRIDLPRTWRFLEAVAADPDAHLQRVFVAEHLRTLLLEEAARRRAPRSAVDRVGEAACQPEVPHDDHLHLRFFCTAEDVAAGCEDSYPIYPWHRRELTALGTTPVQAHRRPADAPRAKTVSRAEARQKAGPMHFRAKAFLDLRETWSEQPHPGRPWCP